MGKFDLSRKKIGFLKNVLCLRPNLSCRKQKTNPPKIGTSLQIPCIIPPPPLESRLARAFWNPDSLDRARQARFQGGRGETQMVSGGTSRFLGGLFFVFYSSRGLRKRVFFLSSEIFIRGKSSLCPHFSWFKRVSLHQLKLAKQAEGGRAV